MSRTVIAAFALIALATCCRGEESIQIPLKDIWAYDMPGTRDLRMLEPEIFGDGVRTAAQLERANKSLTSTMLQALTKRPTRNAGAAFAVKGTGREALQGAHAVMTEKVEPADFFAADEELSVVFFSRFYGAHVHLDRVERKGNDIDVQYRFVPHFDAQQTLHFAIIPIGHVSPGDVKVKITRLPLEKKYVDLGIEPISAEQASGIVCGPCEFSVHKPRHAEKN